MLLLAGRRCNIHLVMVMVAGAADGGVVDRKNKKKQEGRGDESNKRHILAPIASPHPKFKF